LETLSLSSTPVVYHRNPEGRVGGAMRLRRGKRRRAYRAYLFV
jgi:hypothetical protein